LSRSLLFAELLKRKKRVVVGPLIVVGETFVGLLNAVELVLLLLLQCRIRDLVGMALEHQFAVGGLDSRGVGGLVDAQGLVVIGSGIQVHGDGRRVVCVCGGGEC
jgi:hypothetical protein